MTLGIILYVLIGLCIILYMYKLKNANRLSMLGISYTDIWAMGLVWPATVAMYIVLVIGTIIHNYIKRKL